MALHMRRTLLSLRRATSCTLKVPEAGDVAAPLLLTVRTKKRIVKPIDIGCTGGIFDPYVPPEGDARLSSLSKEGLRQRTEQMQQSAASQLAIRKIKELEPQFSLNTFPEKAREIYIKAHDDLTSNNKQSLLHFVTKRCYSEMRRGTQFKTIRWKLVESLEPPRVVHARCPDMVWRGNLYGQVTVRMHYRQTLAIYDRFGRLMLGGEDQPKDVLEYLVMERHLMNPYGGWRLHGKIVPSWAPAKDPIAKTWVDFWSSAEAPGGGLDSAVQ